MGGVRHSRRLLRDIRSGELDRRKFLGVASASAVAMVFGAGPFTGKAMANATFADDPFQLGIASGDPISTGVVLWTRIAPEPLAEGGAGGMPRENVAVRWEVSEYENFRRLARTGSEIAYPELGHAVHAEVNGLKPDRWYYYRFRVGREISPVGRTKTAPAPGQANDRLRFAFASCQAYPDGYYTAHQHLAQEDLDLVVHLGDYIYEYGIPNDGGRRDQPGSVPPYLVGETFTLDRYRLQHSLYKSDQNLQAVHRNFPWIVTWDDHEVENNYADSTPEASSQTPDPADFLVRRANAYRAYYEHMPLRRSSIPVGPDMQLYRRLTFGQLAEFSVLDTRQFRSDQAAGDGVDPPSDESRDPSRSITGPEQERWLLDGLGASQATWNVIAQQVMMSQWDLVDEGVGYSMDSWDGYAASRDRVLGFVTEQRIANPVVITGDVHANWASNLKADFDDPDSPTIGVEFTGTSISSGGDGADTSPSAQITLRQNPHFAFHNGQRGYVRCTVTPDAWQADYRVVPFVGQPGAEIATRASFVTEAGDPGLRLVDENAVPTVKGGREETYAERLVRERAQGDGPLQ